jgi:hypothetical protein
VWEQASLLDDVTDVSAQLVGIGSGDILTVDHDAARSRLNESIDHLHRGRLAAARRADEHHDLPPTHGKVEVVHNRLAVPGKGLGKSSQFDEVLSHGYPWKS